MVPATRRGRWSAHGGGQPCLLRCLCPVSKREVSGSGRRPSCPRSLLFLPEKRPARGGNTGRGSWAEELALLCPEPEGSHTRTGQEVAPEQHPMNHQHGSHLQQERELPLELAKNISRKNRTATQPRGKRLRYQSLRFSINALNFGLQRLDMLNSTPLPVLSLSSTIQPYTVVNVFLGNKKQSCA